MSAFSPYPDRHPPPPAPHSTPLGPLNASVSVAPDAKNGTHPTRKPVYNPYDKFSADDFDAWINNITGALRNALGQDAVPSPPPPSAAEADLATHENDELARHRAQIYNATRNGASGQMHLESDDDAEVENSFAEIMARKARGNKGKARDPREGPGLRPGANRLQPIEIVSSDEEDEKEVEMSVVLDEDRSDEEEDEEGGSNVFGSEEEQEEEEEGDEELGSGEEYEEDEEEEDDEEEQWPGKPSTSQNIRREPVRSRPTLYKDEVDGEDGEEEEEEGGEYGEEYDHEEEEYEEDSRPLARGTRAEPEVIELSDSDEEQGQPTPPQRVQVEDEEEDDDYEEDDEHEAYSQPQSHSYPSRVSREEVEEDFLSGDEDADADEIYPPQSHTFARDDSAFIPSRASPEGDDDENEEGIQLPDIWSGPRAYAGDYYAGGDRFVGHQSQGQPLGDPHHIGSEDEEEYDAEEAGYDEEETQFREQGDLQSQFHPQHQPQAQAEEEDDDEIQIIEPDLPPQPSTQEVGFEEDAIEDDDAPVPELADNWPQAAMYADDLYTDGDVIIPVPTEDAPTEPLDKAILDQSDPDVVPTSDAAATSFPASVEQPNPRYLLGSASAPLHTQPTTTSPQIHTESRSAFAPASVFGLDASAPASLFGPSGFTLEHDFPLPVPVPEPSDVPPPQAVSASTSVETSSSLAREEREREMNAFLTPGALSPVVDQDESAFEDEAEGGPEEEEQEMRGEEVEHELEMTAPEEVEDKEEMQDVAVEVESLHPLATELESKEVVAEDEAGDVDRQGSVQPLEQSEHVDLDVEADIIIEAAPKEEVPERVETADLEGGEAKSIKGDVEVIDGDLLGEEEGTGDQDQDRDQAEAQTQPQTQMSDGVQVEDSEEDSMLVVPPSAPLIEEPLQDEKGVSSEQESVEEPQAQTSDIAEPSLAHQDPQEVVEHVEVEEEHPKIAIQPIELDDDEEEEDEEDEEDQLASSPPEGVFARDDDIVKEEPTAAMEVGKENGHDGSQDESDRTPRPTGTPEDEETKILAEHELRYSEVATLESDVQDPVDISESTEAPTTNADAVVEGEDNEAEDVAIADEPVVTPVDSTTVPEEPESSTDDLIQPAVEVIELDNSTDALDSESPVIAPPEHADRLQDSAKESSLDIREVSLEPSSRVEVEQPAEVIELDTDAEKDKEVVEDVIVDGVRATPILAPAASAVPGTVEGQMEEDALELEYVDEAIALGSALRGFPVSTGSTPEMLAYPMEALSPIVSESEGLQAPTPAAGKEEEQAAPVRQHKVEMEEVFDDEDEKPKSTFHSGLPSDLEIQVGAEHLEQHSNGLGVSSATVELEIEEEAVVATEDNEAEPSTVPPPTMDYVVSEPVTEMEADENLGVTDDDADGELDLEVEVLSVRSTSSLGEAPVEQETVEVEEVKGVDDTHVPEVQQVEEGAGVQDSIAVVDLDTEAQELATEPTAEPEAVAEDASELPVAEPVLEAAESVKDTPAETRVEHAAEGELELLEDVLPSLGGNVEEDKKTSTDLDFSEFIADSLTPSPKAQKPAEIDDGGVATEVTHDELSHDSEGRLSFIQQFSARLSTPGPAADPSYYDTGSLDYLGEHTPLSDPTSQKLQAAGIKVTNHTEGPLEELEPDVPSHDAVPEVTKREGTPPPPEEIVHAADPFKLMGTDSNVAPGEVKDDPGLVGVEASPSASPPDVVIQPDRVPKPEPETAPVAVAGSEPQAKEETPVVNEPDQDQSTDVPGTGPAEETHKREAEEEPAASSQTKKRKRGKSPSAGKRNGGASKGKGKRTKSPLKKSTTAPSEEPTSNETIVVKPRHGLKRSSLSTLAYDKNSEATPMDASSSTSAYRLLVPGSSRASSSSPSEKSAPSPTVDKPFAPPPPVALPLPPAVASQPFIHAHGAAKKRAKALLSQPHPQRGGKRQAPVAAPAPPPAPTAPPTRDPAPSTVPVAPLAPPPSPAAHSVAEAGPPASEPGPTVTSLPPVSSTTVPPSTPTSTLSVANDTSSIVTPTSATPTTQTRTPRASQLTSASSLPAIPTSPSKPLAASPSLSALKSSAASSSSPRHSPISSSLITRSHCRYHRISIPKGEEGPRIFFLVPGCSLTNRELMIEEEIEDHGDATHEDSTKMLNDIETLDLDGWLISVLRHLVGPDIMREQEVFCLPQDGEVIPRKPPKRKSERASFARQSAQHDSSSRASPPVSVAGSTSTSRSVVRKLLDSEHGSTASWSTSASEWEESEAEDEDESPAKRVKTAHGTDAETPSAPSVSMGPPPSVENKRKPRKMKVADMAYIPPLDHAEISDEEQPKRKPRRKSTATSVASSSTTTPAAAPTTKRGVKRARNEKAGTEEGQSEPKPKRARKPKNAPAPVTAAPPQSPAPVTAPVPPSPTTSQSQPQQEEKVQPPRVPQVAVVPPASTLAPPAIPAPPSPRAPLSPLATTSAPATPALSPVGPAPSTAPSVVGTTAQSRIQDTNVLPATQAGENTKAPEVPVHEATFSTTDFRAATQPSTQPSAQTSSHLAPTSSTTDSRTMGHYGNMYRSLSTAQTVSPSQLHGSNNSGTNPYSTYNPYYSLTYQNQPATTSGQIPYGRAYQQWPIPTSTQTHPWTTPLNYPLWYPVMYRNPSDAIASATYFDPSSATQQTGSSSASGSGSGASDEHVAPSDVFGDSQTP